MRVSPKARVINVAAGGYGLGKVNFTNINLRNGVYNRLDGYNNSKLCQVLFNRELARRLNNIHINTYSLNPGAIDTDIKRHTVNSSFISRLVLMSPELGSQTTLYCALENALDNESGFHYDNCRRVKHMAPNGTDNAVAGKLWDLSVQLVQLEPEFRI
ncbi:unnamed protein product [Medioppia subpectinata]|uniref:Uncharacterized protein n=1 Tax=Medioppia subpectinata TaxID=1979941 RepID=A0A7R9KGD0_9ACAR|nr:unnamed protein product [Medioppia subpectinata]CAG2102065.1 unnamed protein product [Medioppia subpectinata]